MGCAARWLGCTVASCEAVLGLTDLLQCMDALQSLPAFPVSQHSAQNNQNLVPYHKITVKRREHIISPVPGQARERERGRIQNGLKGGC